MYSISLLPKPAIRVYRECTSIVKVAWFAAYIFGNLLVAVQIKGSRWLWRHWCSIHHWCATSWATPIKHFVKIRQFLTDWVIRKATNGLILYLCNIYIVLIYGVRVADQGQVDPDPTSKNINHQFFLAIIFRIFYWKIFTNVDLKTDYFPKSI